MASVDQPKKVVLSDVWVQCCNGCCQKWRKLNEVHDPTVVAEQWTCENNDDKARDSCVVEEESWEPDDNPSFKRYVTAPFAPGCLVVAHISNQWWPAIVDYDPEVRLFLSLNPHDEETVRQYHIVLLDWKPTWIRAEVVERFDLEEWRGKPLRNRVGKRRHQAPREPRQITTAAQFRAFQKAIQVSRLPLEERLLKHGVLSMERPKVQKSAKAMPETSVSLSKKPLLDRTNEPTRVQDEKQQASAENPVPLDCIVDPPVLEEPVTPVVDTHAAKKKTGRGRPVKNVTNKGKCPEPGSPEAIEILTQCQFDEVYNSVYAHACVMEVVDDCGKRHKDCDYSNMGNHQEGIRTQLTDLELDQVSAAVESTIFSQRQGREMESGRIDNPKKRSLLGGGEKADTVLVKAVESAMPLTKTSVKDSNTNVADGGSRAMFEIQSENPGSDRTIPRDLGVQLPENTTKASDCQHHTAPTSLTDRLKADPDFVNLMLGYGSSCSQDNVTGTETGSNLDNIFPGVVDLATDNAAIDTATKNPESCSDIFVQWSSDHSRQGSQKSSVKRSLFLPFEASTVETRDSYFRATITPPFEPIESSSLSVIHEIPEHLSVDQLRASGKTLAEEIARLISDISFVARSSLLELAQRPHTSVDEPVGTLFDDLAVNMQKKTFFVPKITPSLQK